MQLNAFGSFVQNEFELLNVKKEPLEEKARRFQEIVKQFEEANERVEQRIQLRELI